MGMLPLEASEQQAEVPKGQPLGSAVVGPALPPERRILGCVK